MISLTEINVLWLLSRNSSSNGNAAETLSKFKQPGSVGISQYLFVGFFFLIIIKSSFNGRSYISKLWEDNVSIWSRKYGSLHASFDYWPVSNVSHFLDAWF